MRPPAYFQDFDTVNFDLANFPQDLRTARDQVYADLNLYSVFYEVRFAPNQVLDLLWLRDDPRLRALLFEAWPYALSVDTSLRQSPAPFTGQLVSFLKRGGDDAFIFSSKHDNIKLAAQWGQFAASDGAAMSDHDLLREASRFGYHDIVDWAKTLDALPLHLTYFGPKAKFPDVYSAYLDNEPIAVGYLPPARNRSHAYRLINTRYPGDLDRQRGAKHLPDLASSLVYASGLSARCVLKRDSPFEIDRSIKGSLTLDLRALYREFPIRAALRELTPSKLGDAREAVSAHVNEAWHLLSYTAASDTDVKHAFGKALAQFLEIVLGLRVEDALAAGTISTKGPSLPLTLAAKLYYSYKLFGIDKFIMLA